MATSGANDSFVYLGLAGETGRGRVVQSGLYRMADGDDEWESLHNGLPEAPAIRALAVHPRHPEIVYAGTQSGPYRSDDHGLHWEKIAVPDHGLPVWSFLFHPVDPKVIFVGYENCEIYRSDDGGERWTRLPVSVRFPDITTAPGSNPAKRVLMLDASANEPDHLYAAIEVGGTLRSVDGGEHWENLSHGQYLERRRPSICTACWPAAGDPAPCSASAEPACSIAPTVATTGGTCRWSRSIPKARSIAVTSTRCRAIRANYGWQQARISRATRVCCYTAAMAATAGPRSTWACSRRTPCSSWRFDERRPSLMSCATNGGEVYSSLDAGETWTVRDRRRRGARKSTPLARG